MEGTKRFTLLGLIALLCVSQANAMLNPQQLYSSIAGKVVRHPAVAIACGSVCGVTAATLVALKVKGCWPFRRPAPRVAVPASRIWGFDALNRRLRDHSVRLAATLQLNQFAERLAAFFDGAIEWTIPTAKSVFDGGVRRIGAVRNMGSGAIESAKHHVVSPVVGYVAPKVQTAAQSVGSAAARAYRYFRPAVVAPVQDVRNANDIAQSFVAVQPQQPVAAPVQDLNTSTIANSFVAVPAPVVPAPTEQPTVALPVADSVQGNPVVEPTQAAPQPKVDAESPVATIFTAEGSVVPSNIDASYHQPDSASQDVAQPASSTADPVQQHEIEIVVSDPVVETAVTTPANSEAQPSKAPLSPEELREARLAIFEPLATPERPAPVDNSTEVAAPNDFGASDIAENDDVSDSVYHDALTESAINS